MEVGYQYRNIVLNIREQKIKRALLFVTNDVATINNNYIFITLTI